MRECFPIKKAGDSLSAAHVNNLSSVARRFARFKGGGGLNARHGDSFFSASTPPPFVQGSVFVYALPLLTTSSVYTVRLRVFNHTSGEWETDERSNYELDAGNFGAKLLVGDCINGYWDDQRGAYIPCSVPTDRFGKVTESSGIDQGGSGEVTLYYPDRTPTSVTITAYYTWMTSSDPIAVNSDVSVSYRQNNDGTGRYIITNAECV